MTEAAYRYSALGPLVCLVVVFGSLSRVLAGNLALPFFNEHRWLFILALATMYALTCTVLILACSVLKGTKYLDPDTGQVRVGQIWRNIGWNPLSGVVVLCLTAYGATASGNLVEIYRVGHQSWHDPELWRIESSFLTALQGSWLDQPGIWDFIYFQMWSFVILAAAVAHWREGLRSCVVLGVAVVLAFFMARGISLAFPTAGPVFYRAGWFSLNGTISGTAQTILREYMAGRIAADGVIPATMAMPSLHVGLTAIAAGFLARQSRWTLFFSLPWLMLVWISTVMLGWHYALDGLVGMAVAGLAVVLANALQDRWDRDLPACRLLMARSEPVRAGG